MEDGKIILVKIGNGEEIIAEEFEHADEYLTVKNPFGLMPGENGTVLMYPWSVAFAAKGTHYVRINGQQIVYVTDDVPEQIQTAYKSNAMNLQSNVITPEPKKLILN